MVPVKGHVQVVDRLIGVLQIIHPVEGRVNFWCTFSEGPGRESQSLDDWFLQG